jgi:signal peptidase II
MNVVYRLVLVCLVILSSTACDQATKSVAKERLATGPPVSLLAGSFQLVYTENPGAILGLGASLPEDVRLVLFAALVCVVVAVTILLSIRSHSLSAFQLTGLALIAGGGMGNLIDRVMNRGWVVDFMILRAGPVSTGVFNVADVAIFAGVTLLLVSRFRENAKRRFSSRT